MLLHERSDPDAEAVEGAEQLGDPAEPQPVPEEAQAND